MNKISYSMEICVDLCEYFRVCETIFVVKYVNVAVLYLEYSNK